MFFCRITRIVKKIMALLNISKKLSNAEAKIAMEPVKKAKKAFVRNNTILATNDKLMAKWTIQLGEEEDSDDFTTSGVSSSETML